MSQGQMHVAVIGHLSSGKSTTVGQILLKAGAVDESRLQEVEKEATELNHRSLKYAWLVNKLKEEREQGCSVDFSLSSFAGAKTTFTLVDCPGQRKYTKNAVTGITQSEAALLVLDAAPQAYEAGKHKDAQAREHLVLASSLGIKQLVVAVNKMDTTEPAYSKDRFEAIVKDVSPLLQKAGFPPAKVKFVPISAFEGDNITERSPVMDWYRDASLFQALEELTPPDRAPAAARPLRLPIHSVQNAAGVGRVYMGKVESGTLKVGAAVSISPGNISGEVKSIHLFGTEVKQAGPGLNVGFHLKISGGGDKCVGRGMVVSETKNEVAKEVSDITAQMIVMNHPGHIAAGYSPVMECHVSQTQMRVVDLLSTIDRKTGKEIEKDPKALKTGDVAIVKLVPQKPLCVEAYSAHPGLGRFVIRDSNRIVAMGNIKSVNTGTKDGDGAPAKSKK